MGSVFDELKRRGFVQQVSDDRVPGMLAAGQVTVYAGFDPTADSMHLGHLIPVMILAHLQRAGHKVLAVMGGATGMIGDPSGKNAERNLLDTETIQANVAGMGDQMGRYLDFDGDNPAELLNNHDWIGKMSFIDWLRDVGKYFSVNYMLAKDSVKSRLASTAGISFTEFSYMTLQSYDFLHLHREKGCSMQIGGSDQWGNITAGIDLVRKRSQAEVFAMTNPLLTTANGEKFGKSAGNAVWLDPDKTSPWAFYQYLVRQDDRDVIKLLMYFTFVDVDEIDAIAAELERSPEKRHAQKRLALEVTSLVHGIDLAQELARAADVMYGSEITGLSDQTLATVFADVPSTEISAAQLAGGIELAGFLSEVSMCKSRGEANRLLKGGGVYVNNVRSQIGAMLDSSSPASESFIILRTGKKNYHLVKIK